ncbi:2-oxo acid dehydrogenase subunit E2 [Oceanobacillus luteolus]|uniref:Dihydrolipoamide acetyltransferase component of pyruvate dehydrogenase complex n=1 Tax=Oceanobacillus luteolus TaxID=1274358 RepID=A0ABW4HY32_9BACI|nr:dihydrolipoamide acetyltransferase family protein [Oceanobacillus luteolus]MCM3738789.1 2-oxo acid dehydrogenase subunit E2 [Oceanobacillus luteolus]
MALEKITMPQLGESVTEGTITTWLVKPGDKISKYDPIAEVMTDKVNAEVPSSFSGTIKELTAEEGETLAVGEVICHIEIEGGESEITSSTSNEPNGKTTEDTKEADEDQSMKKRYSPAVLRLAQENDIDLNLVNGTGRGGRITRKDIEKIIASGEIPTQKEEQVVREQESASQQQVQPKQTIKSDENTTKAGDVEIPVTGVRKAIAQKMVTSTTEIPHAWMTIEVDVTDLVRLRNSLKTEFKAQEGYNLTYFAFFVKAVAQALKEFPQLNSTWAGDKIIQRKDINISIAVANEQELFVPVIKHADEKSIKGIAREINELAIKARSGKLTSEDMSGGTFTLNNTGTFGSVQSMGIINHPQAAILQVESIVKRPVIINDMFAARDMVNLCLSLDHRILDGLICGRFLNRLKEILQQTNEETTSIY